MLAGLPELDVPTELEAFMALGTDETNLGVSTRTARLERHVKPVLVPAGWTGV